MYTSCVSSLSFQPTPILHTPNLSARLQGQELKMTTFKNCTSLRNRLYRSRKTKKLKSSPRSLPIKSHNLPTAGHVLVSKNRAWLVFLCDERAVVLLSLYITHLTVCGESRQHQDAQNHPVLLYRGSKMLAKK